MKTSISDALLLDDIDTTLNIDTSIRDDFPNFIARMMAIDYAELLELEYYENECIKMLHAIYDKVLCNNAFIFSYLGYCHYYLAKIHLRRAHFERKEWLILQATTLLNVAISDFELYIQAMNEDKFWWDCTIECNSDNAECEKHIEEWKKGHKTGDLLFIYFSESRFWRAVYICDDDSKIAEYDMENNQDIFLELDRLRNMIISEEDFNIIFNNSSLFATHVNNFGCDVNTRNLFCFRSRIFIEDKIKTLLWQSENEFLKLLYSDRLQDQDIFLRNSGKYKQDLCELRESTDRDIEILLKSNCILNIESIFNNISSGENSLKKILSEMFKDAILVLGKAPCDYAIIVLGSLARNEATTYSDIEFAILIKDHGPIVNYKNKSYFKKLTYLVMNKLINLGETTERMMDIRLVDWMQESMSSISKGVSPDGQMVSGCHTPLGNSRHVDNDIDKINRDINLTEAEKIIRRSDVDETRFELIGTPIELARYHNDDWYERKPALCTVLFSVDEVRVLDDSNKNSLSLIEQYKVEVRKILNLELLNLNQPVRKSRAIEQLNQSLERFRFEGGRFTRNKHIYNAKYDLYRFITMLIDHLAQLFDIIVLSTFDRIRKLFGKGGQLENLGQEKFLLELNSEVLLVRLISYQNANYRSDDISDESIKIQFSNLFMKFRWFEVMIFDWIKSNFHNDVFQNYNFVPSIYGLFEINRLTYNNYGTVSIGRELDADSPVLLIMQADAFFALGDYSSSIKALETASTLSPSRECQCQLLRSYALAYYERGENENAKIKIEQCVELQKQVYGANDKQLLYTKNIMANISAALGDKDEAIAIYLDILSKYDGIVDSMIKLKVQNELALAYLISGSNISEVDRLCNTLLRGFQNRLGEYHPDLIPLYYLLSKYYLYKKDCTTAAMYFKFLLGIYSMFDLEFLIKSRKVVKSLIDDMFSLMLNYNAEQVLTLDLNLLSNFCSNMRFSIYVVRNFLMYDEFMQCCKIIPTLIQAHNILCEEISKRFDSLSNIQFVNCEYQLALKSQIRAFIQLKNIISEVSFFKRTDVSAATFQDITPNSSIMDDNKVSQEEGLSVIEKTSICLYKIGIISICLGNVDKAESIYIRRSIDLGLKNTNKSFICNLLLMHIRILNDNHNVDSTHHISIIRKIMKSHEVNDEILTIQLSSFESSDFQFGI